MEKNAINEAKRNAGYYAAEMVEDGMIVGLGTGSTVFFSMERLSERIKEGLSIKGVPTSYQAAIRAREYSIPLTTLDDCTDLDLAIDGADQVDSQLNLIKGRGAAQTRERIVAEAAKKLIIVVDPAKITDDKMNALVPVEVLPFAASLVDKRIREMNGKPKVREGVKKDGPVITDNGNWILDCDFGFIQDPAALECRLNNLPGVMSCGIFTEFSEKMITVIGKKGGVETLLH